MSIYSTLWRFIKRSQKEKNKGSFNKRCRSKVKLHVLPSVAGSCWIQMLLLTYSLVHCYLDMKASIFTLPRCSWTSCGSCFFLFFRRFVFTSRFISGGAWQVDYVRKTQSKGAKGLILIRSVPLISFKTAGLEQNPKLVIKDDALEMCTLSWIKHQSEQRVQYKILISSAGTMWN